MQGSWYQKPVGKLSHDTPILVAYFGCAQKRRHSDQIYISINIYIYIYRLELLIKMLKIPYKM